MWMKQLLLNTLSCTVMLPPIYLIISICTLTRVATMCQSVLIEEAHLLKSFIISCANSHFTTSATTNGLLSLRLWNVVMTLFPLSCVYVNVVTY